MKIWSVFSVIIVFHLVILGLLLVQPGCQSTPAEQPSPSMTSTAPARPAAPVAQEQLDPAFNAGMGAAQSGPRGGLSAPTRPSGVTRSAPQTGLLEPVLEPVRDGLGVPQATQEYTVAKGDTLSGIARKQGTSLNDLLAANGLNKSSTIYVGQTLQIPSARPADEVAVAELEHSGKEYVVAKGDTLGAIAARSGITVKAIKALNGLTSDTIFVGQKLALPETATLAAPPAPVQVVAPSAPAPAPLPGQSSYVVQPGDTPSGIARKFGITSAQLMSVNNISDPRKLVVGKTLVVPVSGQAGSAAPSTRTATPGQPAAQPPAPAPTPEDPMSVLEALEDEDLPFVEVEVVEQPGNSGN